MSQKKKVHKVARPFPFPLFGAGRSNLASRIEVIRPSVLDDHHRKHLSTDLASSATVLPPNDQLVLTDSRPLVNEEGGETSKRRRGQDDAQTTRMDVSVAPGLTGSPRWQRDASLTPDLQHTPHMSGESDHDSAHPTPADMTTAAHFSSQIGSSDSMKVSHDVSFRAEEVPRKVHYVDTPGRDLTQTAATLADGPTQDGKPSTLPAPASTDYKMSDAPPLNSHASQVAASAISASDAKAPAVASATPPTSFAGNTSHAANPASSSAVMADQTTTAPQAMSEGTTLATATPNDSTATMPASSLPTQPAGTAPSSTASTPASTPSGTPQSFARKRGRPRKHPLPEPNAKPAKSKRKLDPDSLAAAATKKKATAAAAARSAASSAGSLLSIPDLGRLIPQGSSSNHAQTFIQNNLRLFADLFVALQKQAATDTSAQDATLDAADAASGMDLDSSLSASVDDASASDAPSSAVAITSAQDQAESSSVPTAAQTESGIDAITSDQRSSSAISGPGDAFRDEIKKKMADVTKGREAIQAEMLQMRVDASFFENAQKTVDERITVLRDRIAKHTAVLQREREATRQAREASRKAKKDRKAREKGLRDSEREEQRLAQTVLQLEREIAAEEEARRRLDEDESSDEEGEPGLDSAVIDASPSEAATLSATATPSIAADSVVTPDRAIGFSDEELAKVLGISTSELAGFSQTLDLPTLQAASSGTVDDALPSDVLPSATADDQLSILAADTNGDDFDVAAFLEMASSFGTSTADEPASTQQQ